MLYMPDIRRGVLGCCTKKTDHSRSDQDQRHNFPLPVQPIALPLLLLLLHSGVVHLYNRNISFHKSWNPYNQKLVVFRYNLRWIIQLPAVFAIFLRKESHIFGAAFLHNSQWLSLNHLLLLLNFGKLNLS